MTKLAAFFTMDWGSALSNGIVCAETGLVDWARARWRKAGAYSHTGLRFTEDDGSQDDYFESQWDADKVTGKDGVRGPLPFAKLEKWAGKPGRRLEVQEIPGLSQDEIEAARMKCEWAVRTIEYATLQLFQNLNGFALRRGVGLDERSPTRWTCVEMNMRVLPARVAVRHFKLGDYLYDEYCPWGDKGPGFYQLLKRYQEDQRAFEVANTAARIG